MSFCEWSPTKGAARYSDETPHAVATVIVGDRDSFRLCSKCAALPAFARRRKRIPVDRRFFAALNRVNAKWTVIGDGFPDLASAEKKAARVVGAWKWCGPLATALRLLQGKGCVGCGYPTAHDGDLCGECACEDDCAP